MDAYCNTQGKRQGDMEIQPKVQAEMRLCLMSQLVDQYFLFFNQVGGLDRGIHFISG